MPPIILHHGIFGFFGHFKGVDACLSNAGYPVFLSAVHPTAGIEKRAAQLSNWILSIASQFNGQKAILIAHSMGGLDARFMLSNLDMAKHIDTLVTISTPHRGSPYADWCARHLGKKLRGFEAVRRFGLDVQAVHDLTTESCARFNEQTPDVPAVRYFSISTTRPWRDLPFFGIPSWFIIHQAEGQNDGLVSLKSSQWTNPLATWNVDHWHAINQRYGLAAIKEGDISPRYLRLLSSITSESISAKAG